MSVISQEPNFKSLETDPYSNRIIHGLISECIEIARRQNCTFSKSHITDLIFQMTSPFPSPTDPEPLDPNLLTTMYQDLLANRPLEFEVYLGNPVRMAEALNLHCPNLQLLYGIARHINRARTRNDTSRSPLIPQLRQPIPPVPAAPRQSIQSINGRGRGLGPRSVSDGPPIVNGRGNHRPPLTNGYRTAAGPPGFPRQGSFEGDFDQFKDIAMYGDSIGEEGTFSPGTNGDSSEAGYHPRPPRGGTGPGGPPGPRLSDLELRNRELMLRERELQIREREMEMARRQPGYGGGPNGGGGGRTRHNNVPSTIMDDDEDEDDTIGRTSGPPVSQRQLMMGGDNFDMMSMTGRRARNQQASKAAMRGNQSGGGGGGGGGRLMSLGGGGRNKGRSPSMVSTSHATFDPLNENPLMGFTSNRYPGVDTRTLAANSRANSLTSQRMDELGMGPGSGSGRTASMLGSGGGAYPVMSRGPPGRGPPPITTRGRPTPPQHEYTSATASRAYHDPSAGGAVLAPGIPPKDAKVRSTTGSASASSASLGGNGESHSSSSSLEPPIHQTRF